MCDRPFRDSKEMNEHLVAEHNKIVTPHDHVYHLGDFSFLRPSTTFEYLTRLNGKKYYILGNHDKPFRKGSWHETICAQFEWVKEYHELKVQADKGLSQRICLFHYPINSWNGKYHGSWHLHGHSHNGPEYNEKEKSHNKLDIGVDAWDYRPVSLEKVKEMFNDDKVSSDERTSNA
jgi:calcineurin-like phosphoesterase family protein